MRHWSEDELLEMVHGDGLDAERTRHGSECAECRGKLEAMRAEVRTMVAGLGAEPAVDVGALERIWAGLEPQVRGKDVQRQRWFGWGWGLGLAAAAVVIAVAGFYGGHLWEKSQHQEVRAVPVRTPEEPQRAEEGKAKESAANAPRPTVVVVVLGDHLEQSEQLLVELSHPEDAAEDPALGRTARELLAVNREYRERSGKGAVKDPAVERALADLEPVLTALARPNGELSKEGLMALEEKMHTDNLLFELRVVRTQRPKQVMLTRMTGKKGDA